MPYKIMKRDSKWKVYKEDSDGNPVGNALGTHETEEEAKEQQAALYANEEKGVEQKCYDDGYMYVPYTITSFDGLDAVKMEQELRKEVQMLSSAFMQIANNIMYSPDIDDKVAALGNLVSEFGRRTKTQLNKENSGGILSLFKKAKEEEAPAMPIMLFKGIDGTYYWFGIYSNSYKDKHGDILTEESHLEYIKALESGEWEYPDLLLYHIPYAVIGKATMLGYDTETGLAYAGGYIKKGLEVVAENLMKQTDNGMSHGMPKKEIMRDTQDKRLIKRYRNVELSILPREEAANEITRFILEDKEMATLSQKAEAFLKNAGFGVQATQEKMEEIAKSAEGIERKSEEPVATEVPVTESAEKPAEAPVTEVTDKAYVEGLVTELVKSLDEQRFAPIADLLKSLSDQVEALTNQLSDLQKSEDEKIAEKAAATPAFSIETLMNKSIFKKGKNEAEIDGRSTLAKDTPEITKSNPSAATPLQAIQSGFNARKSLQSQ